MAKRIHPVSLLAFLTWLLFCPLLLSGAEQEQQPERLTAVRTKLDTLVVRDKTYLSEVDLSVGKMPLSELLRSVAKVNQVNLSVKDGDNLTVTCNFSRARVDELIWFLCKEYDLDIDVVGNIVSIYPHLKPAPKPAEPSVAYSKTDTTLSYDFINVPLIGITKQIAAQTGVNLVVPQPLYAKSVSGYVSRMPLREALYTLASVNDMEIEPDKNGQIWTLSARPAGGATPAAPLSTYSRRRQFAPSQLQIDSLGLITATIDRGNIYDIVLDICEQLKLNYFFISPINAQTGIYLRSVPLSTFFNVLFTGTAYTYYEEDNIYMFGETKNKEIFATRIIPMQYRTVNKLIEIIPTNLKTGLQVEMFPDLNSIIASGDQRQVARVEQFLRSIDRSVPLISIDVLIVDVSKNKINEAGIKMGLGEAPVKTTGTLSPGIDMTLGASSINKLINSFNGFGSVKLGKVSPNFYMSLKLLEETGNIEMQSTPKLSTLNGHEAMLKSGETQYYKEVNNTYMGTQNPLQSTSYTWKNVEANLTVKLTPYVSEDRQITMYIEIEQSEFTPRQEKEAPPGLSTRSFKSQIRVENEEMVLLGGLERNSHEKSSGGLPLLARIPILKWIFGTAKDNKTEHKLNVFIKPTIID